MAALTLNQLATWMIEHPCTDSPPSEVEGDEAAGSTDAEASGPWVSAIASQTSLVSTAELPQPVVPSSAPVAGGKVVPKRYQLQTSLNRLVCV